MKSSTTQSNANSNHPALRRLTSLIAVVLAVALASTLINRVYSIPLEAPAAPYDGVTLYRALFFASGPVAGKIPTIQKKRPLLSGRV